MLLAKNRNFSEVVIKGDSSIVIDVYTGSSAPLIIIDIIEDSFLLARGFNFVSFDSVRRQTNSAAHGLVQLFLKDASFRCNPSL